VDRNIIALTENQAFAEALRYYPRTRSLVFRNAAVSGQDLLGPATC
jgi:hypothetical protein